MTMIDAVQEERQRNTKLYKAQADEHRGDLLSQDIQSRAKALIEGESRGKVDFHNINDVKARTLAYFNACADARVFPSIMGLAVNGYGVTRQALNQFLIKNSSSPVAEFINQAKDVMADILTDASLKNNANSIQTIFQLKNHFGYTDKVEIEPVQTNLMPEQTAEMLIADVMNLPD